MKRSSGHNPDVNRRFRAPSQDAKVWVISSSSALIERIKVLLRPLTGEIIKISPQTIDQEEFWTNKPPMPALIVLDIGRNVDFGLCVIQRIKRARIHSHMVVLTESFSKDFGAKILSEGVRYYFPHDFYQDEFSKVAENLLKQKTSSPCAHDDNPNG